MSPKPFAVRIFLADGTVDGVKIVAKSKWTGRALLIPRSLMPQEADRAELKAPGLYVLISPDDAGDRPTIEIGTADSLMAQLEQAAATKDFWNRVLVFTSKKEPLEPEQMTYLAARLVQLARAGRRSQLVHIDHLQAPVLSAAVTEETELFLGHILSICPVLGLNAFEPFSEKVS